VRFGLPAPRVVRRQAAPAEDLHREAEAHGPLALPGGARSHPGRGRAGAPGRRRRAGAPGRRLRACRAAAAGSSTP
jgi:hypothetical protein